MQTFMLPKNQLAKIEQLCRRFLWGSSDDSSKRFYPIAWNTICAPRCAGGLGVRNLADVNTALVTKLAWSICVDENKPWVKLIKAKYLRGRKLLDVQGTERAISWVWGSIKQCIPFLREGACFQVATLSKLNIKDDPWIPSIPGFRVPDSVVIPPHLHFVWRLMKGDGSSWDDRLVSAVFPPAISQKILQLPILDEGNERLIWEPSTSGNYSSKSAYKKLQQSRGLNPSETERKQWTLLWQAELHGRHRLLLWKVLKHALPTLDRLARFMQLEDDSCLFCHSAREDVFHLFMECPVTHLIWWNSPWQLRLDNFQHLGVHQWIFQILGDQLQLPISGVQQAFLKHFLCTLIELTWMARNKAWKEGVLPDIHALSQQINLMSYRYWQTFRTKRVGAVRTLPQHVPPRWQPPPRGEFKMNFDAAFSRGISYTGVILRNDSGLVLGAWTNCFPSENSFCAETLAAVQALKIAHSLRLDRVSFEGDALNVVMALSGVSAAENWKAIRDLIVGRKLLESHLFWFISFVPRSDNGFAHNIAAWASSSLFCGQVDLSLLPPNFWEEEIT